MIFWIINAIIASGAGVIYKKSLWMTQWIISDKMYQLVWTIITLVCASCIYFFTDVDNLSKSIIFLLLWSSLLTIFSELFEQYSYKNEKLSVLIPYWEFKTVCTVILWFLLFWESSIYSLLFTLLAWIILIITSIDFKNISFNKYCLSMIISSILWSVKIILFWYLLLELSPFNVFFYNMFVIMIFLFLSVFFSKELSSVKKLSPKMIIYITTENILRFVVWVISLFLIQELWVIQAVLLWMLFMVFTIISSYLFLKEVPKKKDIYRVVFVCICISWGILLG